MTRLENKIAVITGAAGGIGFATAKRFIDEGCSVVLADLSESALREATNGWNADRFALVQADVSQPGDIERCTQAAIERFGGLDIMVANAGIEGMVAPLSEYPVEEFDRVIAINVRGAFLSVRAAAPLI